MTDKAPPFHLALPVHDLEKAEAFYGDVLGCPRGRRDEDWIDFDFFGHQLVTHLSAAPTGPTPTNSVDHEDVPVFHFGVVVNRETWEATAARLRDAGTEFIIEPTLRHEGEPGEQRIFFVKDPSGNALEFKSLTNPDDLFAT
ncbi:MAG: VOC family protein [Pseudomonadota bacterium]